MPLTVETPRSLTNFVGRELGVTEWLVVTEDRIGRFAEVTADRQWIHVEADRARKGLPYGAPIAHGFLTLSLLSYFLNQALQIRSGVKMGINYGLNRVRFPSPVIAGSQIRARVTVLSVSEIENAVQVTYSIAVERRQASKPCCVAEWIVRYYAE
jgi:acyl dehydratase